jgi:hypothetical protein
MREFLLCLLLITVVLGSAEQAKAQDLLVGAKGGYVISDVTENSDGETSSGFAGGAFLRLPVAGVFSFQAEGRYIQKGAQGEGLTWTLNYIEWPLTIFAQTTTGRLRPAAYAGASMGLELACEFSAGQSTESCSDLGIKTKSVDYSLVFGLELDYMADSFALILSGEYNLGIRDINDNELISEAIKNRAWVFSLGFGVPIGL